MTLTVRAAVSISALAVFGMKVPSVALADTMYTELLLEQGMEQHLSCASAILALSDHSELSGIVASYFIQDAAETLHLFGGWKDMSEAEARASSLAVNRATDLLPFVQQNHARAELLQRQSDCVFGRFKLEP